MSTATWILGSETSIGGATLDSLANGATSSIMNYDNTTNLYLYARVVVELGSITPASGGNILLRYIGKRAGNAEDITDSLDLYISYLTTTTSAKRVVFQMVRLYPFADGLAITNNSGVSFAASGNSVYITPYSEQVI